MTKEINLIKKFNYFQIWTIECNQVSLQLIAMTVAVTRSHLSVFDLFATASCIGSSIRAVLKTAAISNVTSMHQTSRSTRTSTGSFHSLASDSITQEWVWWQKIKSSNEKFFLVGLSEWISRVLRSTRALHVSIGVSNQRLASTQRPLIYRNFLLKMPNW